MDDVNHFREITLDELRALMAAWHRLPAATAPVGVIRIVGEGKADLRYGRYWVKGISLSDIGRLLMESDLPRSSEDMCRQIEFMLAERGQNEYTYKKSIVAAVNDWLRAEGVAVRHPENGEPCILIAVKDAYGGKYVLSSRVTKKRSHTTRDIRTLFPLHVMIDKGRIKGRSDAGKSDA